MRLANLLMTLDDETLVRLHREHLATAELGDRATSCVNLENELKSARHLRDVIYNAPPPAFAILVELLDSAQLAIPLSGLRERVTAVTQEISSAVTDELVAHRSGTKIYRRVVAEAQRSDGHLDASELALLRVLREELGIDTVEHFLLFHHGELRQFWDTDHAFLDAVNALRTGGVVFAAEGSLLLPEDLLGLVRQVLGIEASSAARRRVVEAVPAHFLLPILQRRELKSSGSKEEKVARVCANFVQPSEVLAELQLPELRDLCKSMQSSTVGNRIDLIERLVVGYASNADVRPTVPPPPDPDPEPRQLAPDQFSALLLRLRQADIQDILIGIDSRRVTGSKEHLIGLVIASPFSEATLLGKLAAKQLDALLERVELPTGGSKAVRVDRLVECFAAPGNHSAP